MGERVCARERAGRARTAVPVAFYAHPLRAVVSADARGPALAGKKINKQKVIPSLGARQGIRF